MESVRPGPGFQVHVVGVHGLGPIERTVRRQIVFEPDLHDPQMEIGLGIVVLVCEPIVDELERLAVGFRSHRVVLGRLRLLDPQGRQGSIPTRARLLLCGGELRHQCGAEREDEQSGPEVHLTLS